jgi:hypothetical protein
MSAEYGMTDITTFLFFTNKTILVGDPKAKHQLWNSKVSYPSGTKLLELFVSSSFEISAPPCSTHYTSDGRDDVPDIVVHQGVRLSEVSVTDILDTVQLPIIFSILILLEQEKLWILWTLHRLGTVSKPRLWIRISKYSSNKADKGVRDVASSIASAYRLSTRKSTPFDRKYEILGLDRLMMYRIGSLEISGEWSGKEHLKYGKQSWQTAKSHLKQFLTKRGGPRAPSALHGPLGPILYPIDKANMIADS